MTAPEYPGYEDRDIEGVVLDASERKYYCAQGSMASDPWAELGGYLYNGSTSTDIAPSEVYPNLYYYVTRYGRAMVSYWVDLRSVWKYTGTKDAFASRYDLFDRVFHRGIWSTAGAVQRGVWVIVRCDDLNNQYWHTHDVYLTEAEYHLAWDTHRQLDGIPAE